MRAAVVKAFGGPEVIQVVKDWTIPKITNPNDVLIRVAYSGVNPVDTYIRSGAYAQLPSLPYTPGRDGSGIVEDVGEGVTTVKKGDRVWFFGASTGSTAEYAIATGVFPLPNGVSFAQGAAIGVPYLTAYRALFLKGHAKPGCSVLVHGASGGVGTAAVQLAVANGTAGTAEGLELVRQCGAATIVCHRNPDYEKELLEKFPKGFDLIAEMLANVNLPRDMELVAEDGAIAVIGNRGPVEINARGLMGKESSIFGVALGHSKLEEFQKMASDVNTLFETTEARPVIDKVYELNDIAKAHKDVIENTGAKGNLVIRIADLL